MNYLDPEFSTLPAGWSARPLREIVEIHNTKRVPLNGRDRERRQGSYPYCGANGIVDHIDDFRFDGEYVLIAEDGGHWGKQESSSYIMRGKFWVNNHAHAVRAIPDVTTNEFLSFMVNYLNIQPFIGGDARGKLTKAILEQLGIPLPPLPEQKKIAHILSTVQRAIEEQERIIQTTTELKKALMNKLFTEGLRNESQKQTQIGPVPKSWQVTTIDDVTEVKGGKRLSQGDKLVEQDTGFPYIRVTDFNEFSVDVRGLLFLTEKAQRQISRYIINRDDVYISIAGSIGITGMIPPELDGANLTENAARLIAKDSAQLYPRFLMYWLASHHCQAEIKAQTVKNAQPKLALARIKSLKIPLPSPDEQIEIAGLLDLAGRKTSDARAKRNQFQDLFRVLLHEFMTTKTRVHNIAIK